MGNQVRSYIRVDDDPLLGDIQARALEFEQTAAFDLYLFFEALLHAVNNEFVDQAGGCKIDPRAKCSQTEVTYAKVNSK